MDNNQNNDQLPPENAQQITPPIQGYFNQEPATSQATVPTTPTAIEQPQPVSPAPAVVEPSAPVVTVEAFPVIQPVPVKKSHKLTIIISVAVLVVVLIGLIVGYLLINK